MPGLCMCEWALLLVMCASLVGLNALASAPSTWATVHQQTSSQYGERSQPSIRYGHSAVNIGDQMLITHGYFYDRETGKATWKSDTWAMDLSAPHAWHQLGEGMSQEETYDAYADGKKPYLPAGRFGHSVAAHNGAMYMHGGHDGGISRHGRQNYEPGYDFDEMWKYSVKSKAWKLMDPAPDSKHAGLGTPGQRYLAGAAVVGDKFVIYGGLQEKQGDVWGLDITRNCWELLSAEVPMSEGGPGRRVGHTLTPVDFPSSSADGGRTQGVLLYGGRSIKSGGPDLDPDTYFFDLSMRTWRKLQLAPGSAEPPRARKYHAETSIWIPTDKSASMYGMAGVVAGGTVTIPGLTCTDEVWAFTLDCEATQVAWQALPALPSAIYDTRMSSSDDALFLFGGHLCTDSKKEHHPWHYVNEVHKLTLSGAGVKLPSGACRVPASDMKQSQKAARAPAAEL